MGVRHRSNARHVRNETSDTSRYNNRCNRCRPRRTCEGWIDSRDRMNFVKILRTQMRYRASSAQGSVREGVRCLRPTNRINARLTFFRVLDDRCELCRKLIYTPRPSSRSKVPRGGKRPQRNKVIVQTRRIPMVNQGHFNRYTSTARFMGAYCDGHNQCRGGRGRLRCVNVNCHFRPSNRNRRYKSGRRSWY